MFLVIQRKSGIWYAKRNGQVVASNTKLMDLLQHLLACNLIRAKHYV